MTIKNGALLSHSICPENIKKVISKIKQKILQAGDKSYVRVEKQLELLNELSQFDLGRFLIQHGGLNGFWTHYILTYPQEGKVIDKNNRGEPLGRLEKTLLNDLPIVVATQERFKIFLKENQKAVKSGAKLASIPCGMLGELLYLDYKGITDIKLFGLDYDSATLNDAKMLALKLGLTNKINLIKTDAWQLNFINEFNLISSNGLNIYEPDDKKIVNLYKKFYQALVPGGKLVTSSITYPPSFPEKTEWKTQKLDYDKILLQQIIFSDILNSKFFCFRTTKKTKQQLVDVGFKNIRFIEDNAKIFPTVVAEK